MVVTHAIRSGIDKTIVVLGSGHKTIARLIRDYPVEKVYNRQYKSGMLSSIQCGLGAVPDSTDAIMVLLGDQPMIGSEILERMTEAFKKSDKGIIFATYQGKRGHPIVFSGKYIQEIMGFPLKNSLRDLLTQNPGDIEEVETGHPEILRDIDTEKDYQDELKYHKNHD